MERGVNVKINEDNIQAKYFSRGNVPAESHLTLKGWNIPFANEVKYFGVILDRKTTWTRTRPSEYLSQSTSYPNISDLALTLN